MSELPNRPQSYEPETGPNGAIAQYIAERSLAFVQLVAVRREGWDNPEGDQYWKDRRERSDTASERTSKNFYKMTQKIAKELQAKTGALTPGNLGCHAFQALDLCMAPGAFTWGTLEHNPNAIAYGITLPIKNGGYKNRVTLPAERVKFMDITMLANEFGIDIDNIPEHHPNHSLFLSERPFLDQRFQLIFCGGALLRGQERADDRRKVEKTRLTTSQLIIAMQRIVPGGTMVVLLRKAEDWDVVRLLYQFNSFSDIRLFKPGKRHGVRSTFYLVAKNVQPEAESAKAALEEWKERWCRATFGGVEGVGEDDAEADAESVEEVLDGFGSKLIRLATPVWKIQARELNKQDFVKAREYGSKK